MTRYFLPQNEILEERIYRTDNLISHEAASHSIHRNGLKKK